MKLWLRYLAIASCAAALQGCGGGTSLGNSNLDSDNLQPIPPDQLPENRPRPTATLPVIKAKKGDGIKDAYGAPVVLRGVNVKFADDPVVGIDGIIAAKAAGSNAVRLLIDENVTDPQLEGALVKIVENNMIAIVSFTGPKVNCVADDAYLIDSTTKLWRTKWLEVLAEDRFQSNLMINIADGWGPSDIFSPNSAGYGGYIDTYKALIRKFRADGFKVPLVIDAPSCGEDYNAFLANRGRELLAADDEANLILSVQANGEKWNNEAKLVNAVTSLNDETVPYILSSFKGSGVGDFPVDHLSIMKSAAGDNALTVNFPWGSANDVGAFTTQLAKPMDLRGGAALSVNAFISTPYFDFIQEVGSSKVIAHGKLEVALYAKDINGNRLKLGSEKVTNLRPNLWNAIRLEFPKADVDAAMLMAGATSFDLTQVTEAGIELISNGQKATSKGDILFDDMKLWPGVPPLYESNFSADTDGWSLGWGGGTVAHQGNALALTPNGGGSDFAVQFSNVNTLKFNTTLDVKLHMFVPASYQGTTIKVRFYAMFSDAWVWTEATADVSGVKVGEWGEVKASLKFADDPKVAAILDQPRALGFLVGDFSSAQAEPILVDYMSISDRFGKKMKQVIGSQYKAGFAKGPDDWVTSGWGDANKLKVEVADGALVVTPEVSDWPRAVINKETGAVNELDFKGPTTIKMKVFIPNAYVGDTFPMSVFIQDGNWVWWETAQKMNEGFKRGEWNEIAFDLDFTTATDGWARGPIPKRIGIMFYNAPGFGGAAFKIDDIEVVGVSMVDDSEPLLSLDFTDVANLGAFKFDAAVSAGTLTESVFTTAKKAGYKVTPFGWLANAWAGNKGNEAALNIAVSQNVKDPENVTYVLTPRGEEIVNGPYGLAATSVEITPPPKKPTTK